jgi:uncharacterized protein
MGLVAEFRINISKLSEGIHEYTFGSDPQKIGVDDPFKGSIKLKAQLDKNSNQIFLKAEIWAECDFVCDRCLEDYKKQLNASYSVVYLQEDRSTVDINKEEIQLISADTNYIDLDDDVRQSILLAVPQKLLCYEDCQGLCPVCGINKNRAKCDCVNEEIDSRWDELKKLSHN